MKFDFVIGNPPYQDSSHTEKKNTLWRQFIELSLKIVEKDGFVCFVVPSSWMGAKKILKKNFLPYTLHYINKDECKRHFPNVGSTFSYYILQNKSPKDTESITIVNKEISKKVVKNEILLKDVFNECFPRDMSKEAISIIKKIKSKSKLEMKYTTKHHSVHRDRWRLKKEGEFQYPIQNTPTKLYWWNSIHEDQNKKKLVIPTTTYFKNMLITDSGVTQSFVYYLLKEDEDEEIVLHNTNNIVLDYYNECYRYANWNSVDLLKTIPRMPFTKKMSNEEIYDFFCLERDEIKLIEESVTWR